MPRFPPDKLADGVRDRYRDAGGTTSQVHSSAVCDAALIMVILRQVRAARASLQDLVHAGDLSMPTAPGTLQCDSHADLEVVEQELQCVLEARRKL